MDNSKTVTDYSDQALRQEISTKILELNNGLVEANWITQAVVKDHPVEDEHARWCQVKYTRAIVGKVLAEADKKRERHIKNEQLQFVGQEWDYVQTAYVLTRNGDDVQVPASKITRSEWRAKGRFLHTSGNTLISHSDECFAIDKILENAGVDCAEELDQQVKIINR